MKVILFSDDGGNMNFQKKISTLLILEYASSHNTPEIKLKVKEIQSFFCAIWGVTRKLQTLDISINKPV